MTQAGAIASKLQTLIAKRESIFSIVQSIFDLAKKASPNDYVTLSNKVHNVESLKSSYMDCIDKINDVNIEKYELEGGDFQPSFQGVESMYDMCGYILRKYATVSKKPDVAPAPVVQSKVKLPLLELKVFSGDPTEWPLWYESFRTLIDQNAELSNTQKVQYLLSKLSNTALNVCTGILPTADNYNIILQALIQKYDDKRTLAMSYLDKLFKFKSIKSESAAQLNLFIDNFSASVAALKNLNLNNLADFILLALALGKLDPETTKLFEMSVKGTELPTFTQLDKFVKEQAKLLGRMPKSCVKVENQPSTSSNKFSHKNSNPNLTQSFVIQNPKQVSCCACHKAQHPLYNCEAFLKLSPVQRFDLVKQNKICINCLNVNHIVTACKSKHTCNHCSSKHNTLLHFRDKQAVPNQSSCPSPQNISQPQHSGTVGTSNTMSLCTTNYAKPSPSDHTVLLSTVKVSISDQNGKVHLVRMLLDSGSMSHFITYPCAKKLGLTIDNNPTSVQGIGSTSKSVSGQTCFSFSSRFDSSVSFSVHALVVDHVTNKLPTARIDIQALKHLQGLQVSDDSFYEPQSISGILGASLWPLLIQSGQIIGEPNCPIGVRTKLGIVVMGTAPTYCDDSDSTNQTFCTFSEQSLDSMVHKLWEIEQIPELAASPYNEEEVVCEELYKNTVSRDVSGRFTVALPFKESPNVLGDSYMNAKKRLLSLEKKLEKSPEFRQGYNQVLQDFLDSGHMSPSDNISGVFIPHHAVIKESSTTPIRPVFDGSCATTSAKSLNDVLFSGPNIYSDLFIILINFRLFKIGISADIRKMFRQILVRSEDRKFQKILWRFNPQDSISSYTLNTVTFGLKPSPWLALRTVKQLAIEEANKYPLASHVVNRDIYMDDLATSLSDEDEAQTLYSQLNAFFRSGGFELVKWSSSSTSLLSIIPEADKLHKPLEWEDGGFQKILGMQWEPKDDFFSFRIEGNTSDTPCSKRSILSFAAKIWDILGFLCPVIIKIKILLQQLWSQNIGWDDIPPHHIVKTWNEFRLQLQSLSLLSIPRHLGVLNNNVPVTLVGFSDASEKAYACVIYCRVILPNDDVIVRFICAKSKVAPLKTISIPRLELCGALLLSRLMLLTINTFQSRCNIHDIYCFSDSTVALNWIQKCPSRLNTFVANRVTKIQQNIEKKHWFHCLGSDNPADLATRGLTPAELMNEHCIWFTGPSWLSLDISEWNYNPVEIMNSVPEEKKVVLVSVENKPECSYSYFSPIFQRFSSWLKLLNMFVYVLRFIKLLPTGAVITHSDLKKAEHFILKIIQQFHFSHVFSSIHKGELAPPNLRKLNPFIQDGLIRVGGRLVHSNLEYEQKHPILLPQKEHVTTLLVEHYHKHNLHTGSTLLFALLRNNYWILGARNLVRKVVRACNVCFRCKPESQEPFMGNLPDYRVQPAVKAFIHTGLDMGGPFHITLSRHRGVKSQKAYLCLFICMSTKALHLELVSDMTTSAFMAALKRFLARRGPVLHLYSDNGTNFIGAKNQLDELYSFLSSSDYRVTMQDELNKHQISWKFSVPSCPHMSGIWESGIKSVKSHLYKIIGNQILSYEELTTVLTQIECLLNSRPLCQLSTDDSSEPVALTPSHFLTYQPLAHLPSRDVLSEPANRLTRYELLDQMIQTFWKRWSSEYLSTLQVRNKWDKQNNSISVGTVVLIKQDSFISPLQWLLGKVTKIFPGSDGVIRVAEVKTKHGIFKRPVVKLCPLPTQ